MARVSDGDTIRLQDGRRVRLVQIDAPEREGECYGSEAHGRLRALLPAGIRILLVGDPVLDDRDEHGRLLRYVFAAGLNVNVELVARGVAAPYFYRGARGRHARTLLAAAMTARSRRVGLWRRCPEARLDPRRSLRAGPS